ncbi:hypothetical protein LEP1GSC191_1620 [Leptospira borgpetersenii serovar Mini str. 201000851]|uniref:Uncharacterized protein n=2 Tax=Leptospira borgpetersenii TaxID=174 RepID=A0A0S2IW07_LEPBO|nr:hypothetical protein LBBP_03669 [Leptospira borgpetersenii serovar Ballum]EKP12793.1 hypothetical protein LEP1GSC128_3994 [Leptospira borgpetersenii str. 200801926]EKR00302.1 hypothetical protein LEP1GSC121_3675 [Leptospira borgpetersenii serovar Castellonis str. 200801910]EMK13422.1 hypothetical protein LEP1GSC066_2156 [Leptospira sp. serovar Kenya str. Sh9]EMN12216.1 hypothetical protein LEP1GSC055_2302 [Leptospira borgpetersenii str. Brem 307]ENO64856.1 hypothetical protein LEP1GSC191_16
MGQVLSSFCWFFCLVVNARHLTHDFQARKESHFILVWKIVSLNIILLKFLDTRFL